MESLGPFLPDVSGGSARHLKKTRKTRKTRKFMLDGQALTCYDCLRKEQIKS